MKMALFWNFFILIFIYVRQSQSHPETTQDLSCSTQCQSGYMCAWVYLVTGERAQACLPLQSERSPILTGNRLPSALSRASNNIDDIDNSRRLEYERLRKAIGDTLRAIYRRAGSRRVVSVKGNDTFLDRTDRVRNKGTEVTVLPVETTKVAGVGTGCKTCTDKSQCTVSGEYCYHSPTCAMRICQPL